MIYLRRLIGGLLLITAGVLGITAMIIMPNSEATAMKEKLNAIRK